MLPKQSRRKNAGEDNLTTLDDSMPVRIRRLSDAHADLFWTALNKPCQPEIVHPLNRLLFLSDIL